MGWKSWVARRGESLYRILHRLPRRAKVGFIALLSVVTSPGFAYFLVALIEQFDFVLTAVVVYQSVVGSATIGNQLSWLLIAVLVYFYLPGWVPDGFPSIEQDPIVRAVSGIATAYSGLVLSTALGYTPPIVSFGVFQEGLITVIFWTISGLFFGISMLGFYVRIRYAIPLSGPQNYLYTSADLYDIDEIKTLRQRDGHPLIQRAVCLLGSASVLSSFIGVSLFSGWILGILNGFYPVPEILLVGGFTAQYLVRKLSWKTQIGVPEFEIEAITDIVDAFQNLKGIFLTMYCLVGLSFAATLFVVGITVFSEIIIGISHTLEWYVSVRGPLARLSFIFLELWFLVGAVALLLASGLYGLYYWLKQLQRMPTYASYWEEFWETDGRARPPKAVARPRWLFLPGSGMIALFFLAAVIAERGPPDVLADLVLIGIFDLLWPITLVIGVWSLLPTIQETRDSVTFEGGAILVALLSPLCVLLVFHLFTPVTSSVDPILLSLLVLLVVALSMGPDVERYSRAMNWRGVAIRWIFWAIFSLSVLTAIEIYVGANHWLWIFVGGLLGLLAFIEVVNVKLSSASST